MSADSMRFMLESWVRRAMSLRPPPALLLTYLWDKQVPCPPLRLRRLRARCCRKAQPP